MCAFNLKAVVSTVQEILQLFFPFKCCFSDFSFLILKLLLDLYLCSVALAFLFMFLICFLSVLLSVWILSSSLQSPVFSCVHGLGLWSPAWPASLRSPHLPLPPSPPPSLTSPFPSPVFPPQASAAAPSRKGGSRAREEKPWAALQSRVYPCFLNF